ncbi:MAG: hypothetical protein AB1705_18355 [Verrucomicrobiota bacterium]
MATHILKSVGFAAVCAASLTLVGCGKSEAPASAPAPKPAASGPMVSLTAPAAPEAPAAIGAPVAAAPATEAVDPNANVEVKEDPGILTKAQALNLVVADFKVQYGRLPRNLDELVSSKLVPRLPEAPAGKKFALNEEGQVDVINK